MNVGPNPSGLCQCGCGRATSTAPHSKQRRQSGFTLLELLIVVAIILIIAAFAIPNLLRSRIAANEASAVSSLRTMNTASLAYSSTYGNYSTDLSSMGPSNGATPTSTDADLLDETLAPMGGVMVSSKSGYVFSYTAGLGSYSITASPQALNQTGVRYFYTDPSGVIRYNVGAAATSASSPI